MKNECELALNEQKVKKTDFEVMNIDFVVGKNIIIDIVLSKNM